MFISNFFEHISREVIVATLLEVRRVLKPNGQLLLLQPNVRFCGKDYWQFFDHITAVDDRAHARGLRPDRLRRGQEHPAVPAVHHQEPAPHRAGPGSAVPKFPLAWRVLGAQAFMVATPSA